jgi:hypothetical protein
VTNDEIDFDVLVDSVVERLQPQLDELRFLAGRTELLLERTNMLEQILEKKHPKCVGEWEEEKCEGGGSAPSTAAPWHGFKRRSL